MQIYEVMLTYTATTSIYVEARDKNEAEELAWQELASDGSYRSDYGDWSVDSITEEKEETNHA